VSSVLRPRQHSISLGYMGDGYYRSTDPINSVKVLKKMVQKRKKTTKTTKYTYTQTIMYTQKDIHKISRTSPLVYTNTGWLGDSSHRGQGRLAWTAVGLPPRYPLQQRRFLDGTDINFAMTVGMTVWMLGSI